MKKNLSKSTIDIKLIVAAFFIPVMIILIAYAISGIAPFGDKSILMSDLSNEYVDYMVYYREILLGKHSIMYSWNLGMGMNMIGVIAFYLSSPLNIILTIFPSTYIQEAIFFITLIKFGLAGLSFGLYLKKSFNISKYTNLIFSTCYSLMAYNITYTPHIMWMDGIILLPIVLLYLDYMVEKNKKIGLVITLFILFISNFYTAYMIGIFTVIYYWYKVFSNKYKITMKESALKFFQFVTLAVISAFMSAVLIVPTYMGLVKEDNADNLLQFGIRYKFGDIVSKIFVGSFDTMKPGGTPNIYCGLLIIILMIIYFLNKTINKKKKIATLVVLLTMYLSLRVNTLYMIWHGLDNPDWFEARFSFIISFFMIYIAYESYLNLQEDLIQKYIVNIILVLIIILLLSNITKEYISTFNTAVNIALLLLYLLIFRIKINKNYIRIILSIIVMCELGGNILINSYYLQKEESYENRKYYIDNRQRIVNAVDSIKDKDGEAYRIEKDFMRRENEGMSSDYKGISGFCSFYNKEAHNLLRKLGMPFFDKVARYEGTTMVSDSLLGIKYILSHDEDNQLYYKLWDKQDDIYIYINEYALNFATLADKDVLNVDLNVDYSTPFELQNKIVDAMLGENVELFSKYDDVTMKSGNVIVEKANEYTSTYKKADKNLDSYIEYKFNLNEDKILYVYIDNYEGNLNIKINGEDVSGFGGQSKKILKINDNDTIRITLLDEALTLNNDIVYELDKEKFKQSFKKLNTDCLIEEFNDTYIKLNVNKEDEQQLLITSIPYDKGWSVFVNGEKVQAEKVLDSFIAIDLKNGNSIVEFRYLSPGLKIGAFISIIGLVIFVVLIINEKRRK